MRRYYVNEIYSVTRVLIRDEHRAGHDIKYDDSIGWCDYNILCQFKSRSLVKLTTEKYSRQTKIV